MALARAWSLNPQWLLLDEPTNDLDIDTLELLEQLLQDFEGTLFLVSHDRAFLENTVTQIIAFEGKGKLSEFGGGFDDWQRFTAQRAQAEASQEKAKTEPAKPAIKPQSTKTKLSYKEQIELEKLPDQIDMLEKEQTAINNELANPDTYKDAEKVKNLQTRLNEIEALLLDAIDRWEALESKKSTS